MIVDTKVCIAILGYNGVPGFTSDPQSHPTDPTPIYDALVRELATGRDASGRFVRRWVA